MDAAASSVPRDGVRLGTWGAIEEGYMVVYRVLVMTTRLLVSVAMGLAVARASSRGDLLELDAPGAGVADETSAVELVTIELPTAAELRSGFALRDTWLG